MSTDASNGYNHVLDFYMDFIGIGLSGFSQTHNFKAKQYVLSVIMATKMVLLRRKH